MQTYTSISASFAPVPMLNLFKNSHYSFVVKEHEKLKLKKKKSNFCLFVNQKCGDLCQCCPLFSEALDRGP